MKDTRYFIANQLLGISAVTVTPYKPVTWSSGFIAPIYCDNGKILSHSPSRRLIADYMYEVVKVNFSEIDAVAGVVTAGVPWGIMTAERMEQYFSKQRMERDMPFVYVRPETKKHGSRKQIEGDLAPGSRVVVIENIISTGKSALSAVQALRDAGHIVVGVVAIFTYNFEQARTAFKKAQCDLYTLSDYTALLACMVEKEFVTEDGFDVLKDWHQDPLSWRGRERI